MRHHVNILISIYMQTESQHPLNFDGYHKGRGDKISPPQYQESNSQHVAPDAGTTVGDAIHSANAAKWKGFLI